MKKNGLKINTETKKVKKTKKIVIGKKLCLSLLFIFLLFLPLSTAAAQKAYISSDEIQYYTCIVNKYLNPNMERFLVSLQNELMRENNEDMDNISKNLESVRRGGSGSGFVYVDKKGNNYIITNYHVIVGAYRLSATFENKEGKRTTYTNLTVLNVDEYGDLAILAFPNGQKPFKQGLTLNTTPLKDATDVFAAGYGGMFNEPKWGLAKGSIINAHIRPPGMEDWYIQHGAAINPGNSGGPLIVDITKKGRFTVAGINTFYISDRQGSNFAIPSEKVTTFINNSLVQINQETALKKRIDDFIALLVKSNSDYVYEKLSSFLSSSMISRDPAGALQTLLNSGAEEEIVNKISGKVINDPVICIGWAVAFNQIEIYTYKKNKNVKPELLSIESNNFGGYTARFLISGYPYKSDWVIEYGSWKMDDFAEDSGEYNDYPLFATPLPLGKNVIYSFSSALDYDWYVLDLPKSGKLTVWTDGTTSTQLILYYDPTTKESRDRTIVGSGRSIARSVNVLFQDNVKAGKIYIIVRPGNNNKGEYTLCTKLE
ncbi:hypothetical protein R84B8_00501 [Treponema sp. R8-4-B8]